MSAKHESEEIHDNVILLGAGFSANAGIPLLNGFIDQMWNLAKTGKVHGKPISPAAIKTLEDALSIRSELDRYQGRAALNLWNIEDILSLLSFGGETHLRTMTKAIAQVIELTCIVKHDGQLNVHHRDSSNYEAFWRSLIAWSQKFQKPLPPILTFNYDLVLERSLLRALTGIYYRNHVPFAYDGIEVCYSAATCENPQLMCETGSYFLGPGRPDEQGLVLKEVPPKDTLNGANVFPVEILKLHGSVNFPRKSASCAASSADRLTKSLDDPLILPRFSTRRPIPSVNKYGDERSRYFDRVNGLSFADTVFPPRIPTCSTS
jgi:hypothetical protein